jgi:glucosamine--fructose-6-phosphate aminotransferase (isomerizing)
MVVANSNTLTLEKAVGKVANLGTKITANTSMVGNRGIAHTRRATHGRVTEDNCHPHVSNDGSIYVVHNGIIENYAKLKKDLITKGYMFYSDTDTEVIANLIQALRTGDLGATVDLAVQQCRGAYALVVLHRDQPDTLVGIKLGSPLIFAYDATGNHYFSSDAQALSGYADKLIYLEEGDSVIVEQGDYRIHADGQLAQRDIETFDQEALAASK